MQPERKPLVCRTLHETQRVTFAFGYRQAARIPVIVEVIPRMSAQSKATLDKLFGVMQGKAELKQVDAAHPKRVELA